MKWENETVTKGFLDERMKEHMEDSHHGVGPTGQQTYQAILEETEKELYGKGVIEMIEESRDPWIHRSKRMVCDTCMFFVEKIDHPEEPRNTIMKGRCRRHAPTLQGYPVVFSNDWCGDHKLS